MAQSSTGGMFNATYTKVVNTVLVLIESSLCLIVGMLPLVLALFLLPGGGYWPLFLLAAWLSTPGLAALFAIFRDQPVLFSSNATVRAKVWTDHESEPDFPPDWISAPYVPTDATVAFIKPYFRAWKRLALRTLAVGAFFWLLEFCLVYDILMAARFSWGAALVPVLVIVAAMCLEALMVALILAAEYPKARYWALIKNGFLLSVRRIPTTLLTVVALAGYVWALWTWTLQVLVFATGIAAYLVYAAANWQANLMFVQMAKESGDPRIMDMYRGKDKEEKHSWFSSTRDYQS